MGPRSRTRSLTLTPPALSRGTRRCASEREALAVVVRRRSYAHRVNHSRAVSLSGTPLAWGGTASLAGRLNKRSSCLRRGYAWNEANHGTSHRLRWIVIGHRARTGRGSSSPLPVPCSAGISRWTPDHWATGLDGLTPLTAGEGNLAFIRSCLPGSSHLARRLRPKLLRGDC